MKEKLLTVAIPTYNRSKYLEENIKILLPQLNDDIEVIVLNNSSTDDTAQVVKKYEGQVSLKTHERNVGAERNILSCFKAGSGKYVWTLCDDDVACVNSIELITTTIRHYNNPPILFLKSDWQDVELSNYSRQPVTTTWQSLDRNQFLDKINQFYSVTSSNVIRRDTVKDVSVETFVGTNLSPVLLTLELVGRANKVLVPEKPLVICRGGNTGGYNGLTTFTKNTWLVFNKVRHLGYRRDVLRRSYKNNLDGVLLYVIQAFPLTIKGILDVTRYSFTYKPFYTKVLPLLFKRIFRGVRRSVSLS